MTCLKSGTNSHATARIQGCINGVNVRRVQTDLQSSTRVRCTYICTTNSYGSAYCNCVHHHLSNIDIDVYAYNL